ncbi:MAG: hypothetical protein A2057_17025 [Ignavibacteria bacterium GWA2_35_9]|nr:MAG: hypothetical protein A2057_17025 [Ignavibacteria bacterium GWA2_35_9]OGU43230.1 MAG: hypothetical protein A2000_08500 [Ignavibacteria bacterium GWB2_36_8]OGU50873.1 MAG: hypothetical protein A2080_03925 [Ignavibacteria bacterium GWC2_36_12]
MMKKFLIIAVVFMIVSPVYYGQNGSSYTRIGLGDVEHSYSARRLGMGQLGVSVADENFINSLNPAGWYKLSKSRIEFGLYYNGMFLSDNSNSGYVAETEFSGLTIAFPASQLYGIGIAAGLVPFSNVSYNVEQTFYTDDPYKLTYQGSGGLTKLFLGTSYKLPFDLVLGGSVDYYFGNLKYKSRIDFLEAGSSFAEYENVFRPDGVGVTFGFISPDFSSLIDSGSITDFRFGGSISYLGNLNIDSILTATSSSGIDTVSYGKAKAGVPFRLSLGLNTVFNNEYLLSLDYTFQPWSDYKINGFKRPELRNFQKVSLGFEYKPEKDPGNSFWEQIIWRTGLSFEETQYSVNNEGINQYSVTGGFSLPISNDNTLDIGILYAIRGTTDFNLIKENVIRLSLGISFGELWFVRREN